MCRSAAVAAMLGALMVSPGPVGHARAAERSAAGKAEKVQKAAEGGTSDPGEKGKKGDTSGKEAPSCMRCGATCGLQPVCICKPGTKKKPVTEYETECEPFCVPGCGGPPWYRRGGGCTDCPDACGRCPGTVRSRKKLSAETRDEEVAVVKRSVGYVCCRCAERTAGGCCDTVPTPRPAGRQAWWTAWWPWSLP